jgi:hypothetical protein
MGCTLAPPFHAWALDCSIQLLPQCLLAMLLLLLTTLLLLLW